MSLQKLKEMTLHTVKPNFAIYSNNYELIQPKNSQ